MKTAVFICPGRGTYNRSELGYLARNFPDPGILGGFDTIRTGNGQETLRDLDGAQAFAGSRHMRGDNASALIFAASYGDFLSIDRHSVEIVAVTGNSMGWYTALACSGALPPLAGFELANTMGTLMHQASIGGQLIYPFMQDDWLDAPGRKENLLASVRLIDAQPGCDLRLSIDLGGMLVLAGNEKALTAFEASVPRIGDRFPMRLPNHAAFHTPLQFPVSQAARMQFSEERFGQPKLPLVDGRGSIWWPHATESDALWEYTLGHQVTETYDFTRAIRIAAREFAPDLFIIAGPGTTLGSAVIQSLILAGWRGMASRRDFERRQNDSPLVAAMGQGEQRTIAINGA